MPTNRKHIVIFCTLLFAGVGLFFVFHNKKEGWKISLSRSAIEKPLKSRSKSDSPAKTIDSFKVAPFIDEVFDKQREGSGDKKYAHADQGQDPHRVILAPQIFSEEELFAYRERRLEEIQEILEATTDQTVKTPYYPAVITFRSPIPKAELDQLVAKYDFKGVHSARFRSTVGGGEFPYEVLSNESEIRQLESDARRDQKRDNGIEDFKLVEGITVLWTGIHRDSVLALNMKEPDIFLADIGPIEMYRDGYDADWSHLETEVETYLEKE